MQNLSVSMGTCFRRVYGVAAASLPFVGTVALLLMASGPAAGQAFPPAGVDNFPSGGPLGVLINGIPYSVLNALDPNTQVGRSASIPEGGAADVGGAAVPTPGCAACAANVLDANLTCWPPAPPNWETPPRNEVHTEMLSLNICGPCLANCATMCYMAGQPAFNLLAGVGAAAQYQNSFGEVESQASPGPPDFPARSFWDIKGVVQITPPPPGTSGVFILRPAGNAIVMTQPNVLQFPPIGSTYNFQAGTTLPNGAGVACGVFPVPLADATNPGVVIGQMTNAVHNVSVVVLTPAVSAWGLVVMALIVMVLGTILYFRRRMKPALS